MKFRWMVLYPLRELHSRNFLKMDDLLFIDYLYAITDDTGIFQHSKYGIPDLSKGYTTDDNARALILAVLLLEHFKDEKYLKLVSKYLSFMFYAQNGNGKFKNFMNYQREFIEKEGSDDCLGRCLWALGRTASSLSLPENIKNSCQYMLKKAVVNLPDIQSPRAKAYAIVGLSYLNQTEEISRIIDMLSISMVNQYAQYKDGDWHWFEDSITYGNAFFPWSMLKSYRVLKKDILLDTGKESMEFLKKVTLDGVYFKAIGCNGWLIKGEKPAQYDEQPLEACESLLLYLEYYNLTGDKDALACAVKCFCWYLGLNSKNLPLIDEETGACYDGLNEMGLNLNQGSESIISYGIAFMEISKKVKLITPDGQWLIRN